MADKWPRDLWLEAIWEDPTLKPNERVVAYCYAQYAGKTSTTWCSWEEIKRRTGIRSKDAVWRAVSGLIRARWLKEIQPARQHRSAVYRLTCPVDNSPEVRETDLSGVRETDPWNPEVRETAPEVRETAARGPGNGDQRSVKRDAIALIDLSQDLSKDLSPDRAPARSPSGALAARCHRCDGRGFIAVTAGCLELCPNCAPRKDTA